MKRSIHGSRLQVTCMIFAALLLARSPAFAEDVLELSTGAKVRGRVVARTQDDITIEIIVAGRALTRKYPLDRIAAVVIDGRRESFSGSAVPTIASPNERTNLSRAEVQRRIDELGRTPPEWFDSTPLNYPKTLDLSWPQPPPGPWNNRKNVGQYVWDVINPNPGKWREGIRLMHHLLVVNKENRQTQVRIMDALGRMYHNLLEDYARAAFWWQKAGVERGAGEGNSAVHLAECYWRLGSKATAVDLINRTPPRLATIKLWADMGETEKALKLAETAARSYPETAYMYAGDACRLAGRYEEAISYYEKALAAPPLPNEEKNALLRGRAEANIEAIRLFELSDVRRVPDGTYRASSLGYEGQVEVDVVVRNRRIQSVTVTRHKEKQFYSALTDTPAKIVAKQGVAGVDGFSGATITSDAIINATAKALAGAAAR